MQYAIIGRTKHLKINTHYKRKKTFCNWTRKSSCPLKGLPTLWSSKNAFTFCTFVSDHIFVSDCRSPRRLSLSQTALKQIWTPLCHSGPVTLFKSCLLCLCDGGGCSRRATSHRPLLRGLPGREDQK